MSFPAASSPRSGPDHSLHVEVQKRYAAGPQSWFRLDVAFAARPGVTIVLGHSGAGKTTLLRSIAGLCDPEQGRISVAGRILFDSNRKIMVEPAGRRMAYVFQDLALFPHLSVHDNVAYGLRRLDAAERNRRVDEVLKSFQIQHLRRRAPREISGGEQQRVALARSLVTEPSVLLLDEPLSSLDANTKASIIEDLRAWNLARQIPMVYVTHNYEEAFALGEHVISLEQGKIAAEGTPADVISSLRHPSMVQLAAFENLFDALVVGVRKEQRTAICRLAGTTLELTAPLTQVAPGDSVHVGIRADDILLTSERPAMLGACNVLVGEVQRVNGARAGSEVIIDCGVEFRALLPAEPRPPGLKPRDHVWMIVRSLSCHVVRNRQLRASQRLFVFICNRNTSRSPLAAALCNAEIARRLRVPSEALHSMGVRAVSAGLATTPGEPMNPEAQRALSLLNVAVPGHQSRNLTTELAAQAEFVFCMTKCQQQAVMEMFPESRSKVLCIRHGMDFEDPGGHGHEAFAHLTGQLQDAIGSLMDSLLAPVETGEPSWQEGD